MTRQEKNLKTTPCSMKSILRTIVELQLPLSIGLLTMVQGLASDLNEVLISYISLQATISTSPLLQIYLSVVHPKQHDIY